MAQAGDVTVFCDPCLKPAMLALSGLGGFGVYPLCAPGPLMVAQIIRHTRDDVLFTRESTMDDAMAAKLVIPGSRIGGFTNPLVLVGLRRRFPSPLDPAGLGALLARSRLAVTDDTPASGIDGHALLAAHNLTGLRVQGVANTADAAFMVTSNEADLGLVYLSDVQAEPSLTMIAPLSAPPGLTNYAAAVNAQAFSPNAQALIDLMQSPAGRTRLRAAGLEAG
ncbi:MAG TPA: substrate-binding domain-containing protein [Acetobacteraceae bacterium]|nr:substrate-binding domain-containing protein [Acetobacteraceae bacterium]